MVGPASNAETTTIFSRVNVLSTFWDAPNTLMVTYASSVILTICLLTIFVAMRSVFLKYLRPVKMQLRERHTRLMLWFLIRFCQLLKKVLWLVVLLDWKLFNRRSLFQLLAITCFIRLFLRILRSIFPRGLLLITTLIINRCCFWIGAKLLFKVIFQLFKRLKLMKQQDWLSFSMLKNYIRVLMKQPITKYIKTLFKIYKNTEFCIMTQSIVQSIWNYFILLTIK